MADDDDAAAVGLTTPLQQTRLGDDAVDAKTTRDIEVADKICEVGSVTQKKHVIDFFVRRTYKTVGGQQFTGECFFCCKMVTSTGSVRAFDHLLTCYMCPPELKSELKAIESASSGKKKEKREHESFVKEDAEFAKRAHQEREAKLVQQGIKSSVKNSEVYAADLAIANFFYANGLSFGAADHAPDSYYRSMVDAIKAAPGGYVPPGANKIGGELIDEANSLMWVKIKARDPSNAKADKFGSTYTSDGWDSVDHLPLINSAFITANDGGIYWRSVDTSGKEKNGEYCASLMIEDIYKFGCTKVVLVTTDTCTTMKMLVDSHG